MPHGFKKPNFPETKNITKKFQERSQNRILLYQGCRAVATNFTERRTALGFLPRYFIKFLQQPFCRAN